MIDAWFAQVVARSERLDEIQRSLPPDKCMCSHCNKVVDSERSMWTLDHSQAMCFPCWLDLVEPDGHA